MQKKAVRVFIGCFSIVVRKKQWGDASITDLHWINHVIWMTVIEVAVTSFTLATHQLGEVFEVGVPGDELEIVLEHLCGDPEIVIGDGRTGTFELDE